MVTFSRLGTVTHKTFYKLMVLGVFTIRSYDTVINEYKFHRIGNAVKSDKLILHYLKRGHD